jgi:hypothetical protein
MYTTVPFFHIFGKKRVNRKCDFEAVSGRKNTELCATLNLESMWILPFLHATAGRHGVHAAATVLRMMMSRACLLSFCQLCMLMLTVLLRYFTRPELVSYFDRHRQGPAGLLPQQSHLKTFWARSFWAQLTQQAWTRCDIGTERLDSVAQLCAGVLHAHAHGAWTRARDHALALVCAACAPIFVHLVCSFTCVVFIQCPSFLILVARVAARKHTSAHRVRSRTKPSRKQRAWPKGQSSHRPLVCLTSRLLRM